MGIIQWAHEAVEGDYLAKYEDHVAEDVPVGSLGYSICGFVEDELDAIDGILATRGLGIFFGERGIVVSPVLEQSKS